MLYTACVGLFACVRGLTFLACECAFCGLLLSCLVVSTCSTFVSLCKRNSMIPQAGAHCTHGIPDIAGSNSFHENSIPSIERIRGKQQYCEHQHYGDDVISDLQRVLHLFALALCLHDHQHDVLVCPGTSGMHSRTQSISHVRTFFFLRCQNEPDAAPSSTFSSSLVLLSTEIF